MVMSLHRFDQYSRRFQRSHPSARAAAWTAFLAHHRDRLDQFLPSARHIPQVLTLLLTFDQLTTQSTRHVAHWFTVVNRAVMQGQSYLVVRMEGLPMTHYWLAPDLPVPMGIQIRGWLERVSHTTPIVTRWADLRVTWHQSVGTTRLVATQWAPRYPQLQVQRVVRVPGQATLVWIQADSARGRHTAYALRARQQLQSLFYRAVHPIRLPEVFRVIRADLPLANQIAHLLGIPSQNVRSHGAQRWQVRARGTQVASLRPVVESALGVSIQGVRQR